MPANSVDERLALASCPSSPTLLKAHHWVIDRLGQGQCKYCAEERFFAPVFQMGGDYKARNAKAKAAQAPSDAAWRKEQWKKINEDRDFALAEALKETK